MKQSICIMDYCLAPCCWTRLRAATAAKLFGVLGVQMAAQSPPHGCEPLEWEGDFVRVTLFPDGDSAQPSGPEVLRRLRAAFAEHRPSCVAIVGWSFSWSLAALTWCLENRVPAILLSDSTAISNTRHWWKEKLKQRLVSLYSAGLVAGTPQREYLARLGMPRERIFQGWDIVDNNYFATRADEARRDAAIVRAQLGLPEKYFVAVSRFVDVKNLPRLIEAYALYRKAAGAKAWKLVLLGDGPLKPQLIDLQKRFDLSNDLLLPGFKQYAELPVYYGLASAFVLASTSETWGLVVNEAMASGLPVLVSERCGCASDLVANGRNGFTFDPRDVGKMSDLMLRTCGLEIDLAKMGAASRQIIADWSPATWTTNLHRAVEATRSAKPRRFGLLDRLLLQFLVSR